MDLSTMTYTTPVSNSCYQPGSTGSIPNRLDNCTRCQTLGYFNLYGNYNAQQQVCANKCNGWFDAQCNTASPQ